MILKVFKSGYIFFEVNEKIFMWFFFYMGGIILFKILIFVGRCVFVVKWIECLINIYV